MRSRFSSVGLTRIENVVVRSDVRGGRPNPLPILAFGAFGAAPSAFFFVAIFFVAIF